MKNLLILIRGPAGSGKTSLGDLVARIFSLEGRYAAFLDEAFEAPNGTVRAVDGRGIQYTMTSTQLKKTLEANPVIITAEGPALPWIEEMADIIVDIGPDLGMKLTTKEKRD